MTSDPAGPRAPEGESGLRHGLLLRTALNVLAEVDRPVASAQVVAEVANRVTLTERELSRNQSGNQRFDTFIRFASGWMKALGWITKDRSAGWAITERGRAALEDPIDFSLYQAASRGYSQLLRERKGAEGWADPRWRVVRDAVEAVPEGSWTAYKDLADLAGMPARTIGTFLAANDVPGTYRVLTIEGTVGPDFRWDNPERTDDPREVLSNEGVTFDATGRASAEDRVTAEELREFVGVVTSGSRAWLVRGSAVSGVNVVGQWLEEEFVSLAASHLRRLEPGVALEELRAAVESDYAHLTYNQRKAKLAELHAFLNRMAVGDAVATTSEGRVYVGRVGGDARFAEVNDTRTTIRRDVAWQAAGVDFTELDEVLQARLKSSAMVVDLTEVADDVEALLVDADLPGEVSGPAPRVIREAVLPDLPDGRAADLLVGREWLTDLVELLRDRRQVILHGPPGTGKTFLALEVAQSLTDPANVTLVQFHPAYSYEDFFEGYRPAPSEDGHGVHFVLTPGPFRKIVDRAREDPGSPYVLIIDEINRANLAKVFGELYFLLEYRDRTIELMYASGDEGREFSLPRNVYLVGTMNTADRSIALVDAAMRRRFAFLSLHPDDAHLRGVLRAWLARRELPTTAADLLDALNARIRDRDFKVGPSYLMRPEAGTDIGLERIWRTAILPLLEELHYGDPSVDVSHQYGLPALRRAIGIASVTPAAEATAPETTTRGPGDGGTGSGGSGDDGAAG